MVRVLFSWVGLGEASLARYIWTNGDDKRASNSDSRLLLVAPLRSYLLHCLVGSPAGQTNLALSVYLTVRVNEASGLAR